MRIYTCDKRGMIVAPEWPPTTFTFVVTESNPFNPATKVEALTISKVETPNSFLGS